MCGIIKRMEKWVEWTRVRNKIIRSVSSTSGVASKIAQSIASTSMIVANSTLSCPTQSISGRGDQHLENNIQVIPTYGRGSLPNMRKVGNNEKNKEKEQEKSETKPPSPMQVINLDVDNNPLDGQEKDASQKGDTLSLLVTKVSSFLATTRERRHPQ